MAIHTPGQRVAPWRIATWCVAACLLLLPLVAMQFTDDVQWTLGDFVTFGTMLFAACGTCELAARRTVNTAYRGAVGLAVAGAFFLVWINLAVGIIGSEQNRANLLFAGVLLVGIAGAAIARFQARGMALALVATAVAQAGVPVVARSTAPEVLALTGCFVAMWLASAWLFRKASMDSSIRQRMAGVR